MGRMAMLNYDVFEAFKSAGADDEKARKAAEALAGADDVRVVRIDEGIQKLDTRFAALDGRVAKTETKLDFHSRMFGVLMALSVAILVRLLVPV
jgi:hypothetical protein